MFGVLTWRGSHVVSRVVGDVGAREQVGRGLVALEDGCEGDICLVVRPLEQNLIQNGYTPHSSISIGFYLTN